MINMKKILTNYIFKFLFEKCDMFKDGDLLECQGDLFIFDDYIRAKKGTIYNIDSGLFINNENGLEYYKNNIRKATEQEKEIYKSFK
jgi:hypothetical protein